MSVAKTKPAADESTGWRPDPGDTVTGTIEFIEMINSEYGAYPMLALQTANGPVSVHAFHKALFKRLTTLAPQPGDEITIIYNGPKPLKKNPAQDYHDYTVNGPAKDFGWDNAATDADF